ncbi:MAG: AraC family transcriptional regulator [Clostridia bacterium]|nr:AraC family transcriptional regulator [Clostridia bacterium]
MSLISEHTEPQFHFSHAIDKPPRPSDYAMHMHDNYEIYCFISGRAHYIIEGTRYELTPGSILLMRNSESHTLVPGGPDRYERYIINFRRELLENAGLSPSLLRPFHDRALGEHNLYLPHEFAEIRPIALFRKLEREIAILSARDAMLSNLASLLCAINIAFLGKGNALRPTAKRLGDEMIRYINENLLSGVDTDVLAAHVHLSPSQTCRIFKEATGSSLYHYILLKRLILAREMIASGESAGNAALACGFSDYSSFYRLYKKHLGKSPSDKSLNESGKESL